MNNLEKYTEAERLAAVIDTCFSEVLKHLSSIKLKWYERIYHRIKYYFFGRRSEMSYFVYYSDGYGSDNIGLERFPTAALAEAFIESRMSQDLERTIDQYTVIQGDEKKIRTIEVSTKVIID